ncbi:MAG: ISAzo13 family transposase, partial [Verrucomicrobiota bacterium]|nr:ISAzo13 family transposase [Verrucomicrobiota bacterium]
RATGVSRRAITEGVIELKSGALKARSEPSARIRKPGGGRKKATEKDQALRSALEALVEPLTRGDPGSPLRWTCKSLRRLAQELSARGHPVSHRLVGELLHGLGYSLQANQKTNEGAGHPDRNAQFEFINRRTGEELAKGNPVISVDTKKKELMGDFKNRGEEYRPKGSPQKVRVHDFIIPEQGRANPYGVYDLAHNMGGVSVGVDHDTAAFAVESIRRWWKAMGAPLYPKAQHLQIMADGGGSNGSRVRLWKVELQKLAEELGFAISVCHLPPATSKWNKIEHRLFSFISLNWSGQPLVSHEVVVSLIKATTTAQGLKVDAEVDRNEYPAGVTVSDEEMMSLNLSRDPFHGEWNYTIAPRQQQLNL